MTIDKTNVPAVAPADTLATPNSIETVKPVRISKRMREVINLLVTGECKTIKAAAKRVGMHPNYLSGALKKPEIRVFIDQRVRGTIALGTMRASARLIELIDAGSEHVSADVSRHVLAIEGIKPTADPSVSVNLSIKAGYVIDLSDQPPRPKIIENGDE